MIGESLQDEVAHAEAREARAARPADRNSPSHHLGGPPEPWEVAVGDAMDRVSRQGRAVIDYATRMNEMGIHEQSLAGDFNPIAEHVASVGRDKMRLLPGATFAHVAPFEEDASSSSSVNQSDFSDDLPARAPERDTANGGGRSDWTDATDEDSSNGIDLVDDTDIRNAVEDFDSTNWTMEQLEVSCQTLLEESCASEDRRRRMLSAGMLRKLVQIYPTALRWMQRNLEAVVNDGLPSMVKGTLGARVFKVDILMGVLAPVMAESMTQLNVIARSLRLMVFRMDTAVRLITFRYTLPKILARYRELPSAIRTHKRMTLLMQGSELRARWRKANADEKHGSLPPSLLHAYLCIILALIDAEKCPASYRMNRVKMVGGGGLLALSVHFNAADRSQRLACRILRELAREPLLIYELLQAGVAQYLSRLLPKLRETSADKFLEALDAIDSMAFSAMRFCLLGSANRDQEKGNSTLISALVADGESTGGLESEVRIPSAEKVEKTVREQLGLPHLVSMLTDLLGEEDVQLYLAGAVILGKLATTVCFHSVLQEMLAYAGRALERLVQGVQSQEAIVPDISLALFLQLCSRQEGRDGIEASEGAAMLRPLIAGHRAQESPVFLRGLNCAVSLARWDPAGPAFGEGTTSPRTAPSGVPLPRAGGVGLSGPPRPCALDLEGKLYADIVDVLDGRSPGPLEAVRGLVRMGFLEAAMRFLVRDDDEGLDAQETRRSRPEEGSVRQSSKRGTGNEKCFTSSGPHYFTLKQRHACLGAVALHGLAVLAGPHPAIFTGPTLRYLCYSIQVAYIDLTAGRLAPGVGYPLVFRSIQLACRALAFLATCDSSKLKGPQGEERVPIDIKHEEQTARMEGNHGPLRRVADSLLSTAAINEVACMAQMPARAGWAGEDAFMYRHLERTVSSAAILIASVCPVPAVERDPFTRFDEPQDEEASLYLCQPLMERLVTSVGGPLCSTLMVADNLEILAHTCRALAKLSDANTTVQMLLDSHEVMGAIIRLGPKAPALLPDAARATESGTRDNILAPLAPIWASHDHVLGKKRDVQAQACCTDEHKGKFSSPHSESPGQWTETDPVNRRKAFQGHGASSSSNTHPQERNQASGPGHGPGRHDDGNGLKSLLRRSKYHLQAEDISDPSTRKLCSLPFDYFRLVANVARVPSGRAIVQSSGTLKRCLERLALSVVGCPAARLATLRCRSEICVLIARMAGTYDRDTGAANDFILSSRYDAVPVMLGMLNGLPTCNRQASDRGDHTLADMARYNAAYALAELCSDTLKSIPLVAAAGGVHLACRVAQDSRSPMPLLKQVLRILKAVGAFPDGVYTPAMVDPLLLRSLHRISNNAYPGFRPTQTTGTGDSSSLAAASSRMQPTTQQRAVHRDDVVQIALPEVCEREFGSGSQKPHSAEAQVVLDLAREVAYVVGSERSPQFRGTRQKSLTVGRHKTSPPEVERWDTARRGLEDVCAPTDTTEQGTPTHGADTGGCEEIGGSAVSARHEERNDVISGTPGTYLGCGFTSCAGLGAAGEHGDAAGNVAHDAFVIRQTGNYDSDESITSDFRAANSASVIEVSPTAPNCSATDERPSEEGSSLTSRKIILATPLALLSARETSFRQEVVRRKVHYGLGGVGDGGKSRARQPEPDQAVGSRKMSSSASKCKQKATRLSRCMQVGVPAVHVETTDSPLLATTRPATSQPPSGSQQPTAVVAPLKFDGNSKGSGQNDTARNDKPLPALGEHEYVTFARPAAHWLVTASLSHKVGQDRAGGVRMPGANKAGETVGRFACRGYLLDPTFADHNPVILHPRLPRLRPGGNEGSGFTDVPEKANSADLVASQSAHSEIDGTKWGEPFRNVVDVLHHSVDVSGERRAGTERYFDEKGRPLFSVNFHHVFDAVQNRRRDDAGVGLVCSPWRVSC